MYPDSRILKLIEHHHSMRPTSRRLGTEYLIVAFRKCLQVLIVDPYELSTGIDGQTFFRMLLELIFILLLIKSAGDERSKWKNAGSFRVYQLHTNECELKQLSYCDMLTIN